MGGGRGLPSDSRVRPGVVKLLLPLVYRPLAHTLTRRGGRWCGRCVCRLPSVRRSVCPGKGRRWGLPLGGRVCPGLGELLLPLLHRPLAHTLPRCGGLRCKRNVRRPPIAGRCVCWGSCPMAAGSWHVRGMALGVRLALPLLDFLAVLLGLGNRHGNAPLCVMAHLNGGGLGGLLHLLHGPGAAVGAGGAGGAAAGDAGEIIAGYLGGRTTATLFPLGQLPFQLGCHNAMGSCLTGPTVLLFTFALYLIRFFSFFDIQNVYPLSKILWIYKELHYLISSCKISVLPAKILIGGLSVNQKKHIYGALLASLLLSTVLFVTAYAAPEVSPSAEPITAPIETKNQSEDSNYAKVEVRLQNDDKSEINIAQIVTQTITLIGLGITALLGVLNLRATNRKIRIDGISSKRTQWIGSVRDITADIVCCDLREVKDDGQFNVEYNRLLRNAYLLSLYLNIQGPFDRVVLDYLIQFVKDQRQQSDNLVKNRRLLNFAVQIYLKSEWNRVKCESDPNQRNNYNEKDSITSILNGFTGEYADLLKHQYEESLNCKEVVAPIFIEFADIECR